MWFRGSMLLWTEKKYVVQWVILFTLKSIVCLFPFLFFLDINIFHINESRVKCDHLWRWLFKCGIYHFEGMLLQDFVGLPLPLNANLLTAIYMWTVIDPCELSINVCLHVCLRVCMCAYVLVSDVIVRLCDWTCDWEYFCVAMSNSARTIVPWYSNVSN